MEDAFAYKPIIHYIFWHIYEWIRFYYSYERQ